MLTSYGLRDSNTHYQGFFKIQEFVTLDEISILVASCWNVGLVNLENNVEIHSQKQLEEKQESSNWLIQMMKVPKGPSLNSSLYYIIFIADLTRMFWIYFL